MTDSHLKTVLTFYDSTGTTVQGTKEITTGDLVNFSITLDSATYPWFVADTDYIIKAVYHSTNGLISQAGQVAVTADSVDALNGIATPSFTAPLPDAVVPRTFTVTLSPFVIGDIT